LIFISTPAQVAAEAAAFTYFFSGKDVAVTPVPCASELASALISEVPSPEESQLLNRLCSELASMLLDKDNELPFAPVASEWLARWGRTSEESWEWNEEDEGGTEKALMDTCRAVYEEIYAAADPVTPTSAEEDGSAEQKENPELQKPAHYTELAPAKRILLLGLLLDACTEGQNARGVLDSSNETYYSLQAEKTAMYRSLKEVESASSKSEFAIQVHVPVLCCPVLNPFWCLRRAPLLVLLSHVSTFLQSVLCACTS
jgi:hypothetical protein